jgi:hypothetical protein
MDKTQQTKDAREIIVAKFMSKVKGRTPDTAQANVKHCGKAGHWLETQMGIIHNASNSPDLNGYEMKNDTTSKTTFGDWSADYYVFRDQKIGISRDDFLRIFGKPNASKSGRYSWSGEPCPKIGAYNKFGQKLFVNYKKDVIALYSFRADARDNKTDIVPKKLQKNNLIIAKWLAPSLKAKLENKFGLLGWFKCIQNKNGVYTNIAFGEPINFKNWIANVKKGTVFLDSGMYQGNSRNYSQWRADNKLWENLVIKKY